MKSGGDVSQEPKIIDVEEIKYVGMSLVHNVHESAQGKNPVPFLWDEFTPRSTEVKNSQEFYVGVCGPVHKGGASNYTAGMLVSDISQIPSGMIAGTVPAGRYAQFVHEGPIETIWKTVDFIHNKWIPNAGYKNHDCSQVEIYRWGTEVDAPDFKLEILVPLN